MVTVSAVVGQGGSVIRGYRPSDRADVYDVCVRTAEAGGDARGMYRRDDFIPDVFAGPYLALEPEGALAFYRRLGLRELPVGDPGVVMLGARTDLEV